MRDLVTSLEESADKIGTTILKQMGGTGKLAAMVGAKQFVTGITDGGALGGVQFNKVQILLMPDDTYTMVFWFTRGGSSKKIKSVSGVYADKLKSVFESTTGLYLSL